MAGNQEQSQPPTPAAETPKRSQSKTTALYIGDLEENVKESQLYELFSQIGPVESVRVCKPKSSTEKPIGYGYVNYINSQDSEMALKQLNFSVLNGKPIRVMQLNGNRDFGDLGNEGGNVFIKNLDKGIDSNALFEIFKEFGLVLSCKVATDDEGESKGYGFVQFENEECARKAAKEVDGMILNGKKVFVGPYLRREVRVAIVAESDEEASVFVKNLEEEISEEALRRVFGVFGKLSSVKVVRDEDGKSRCFGFVNFVSAEDASKAIEALDGVKFHEKEWYVGKARKKSEVEEKCDHNQSVQEGVDKYPQLANLYVKNLDYGIDEDLLKKLFAPYGYITSLKVVKDAKGKSQGAGFVAFTTPDEASKAIAEMNGKVVAGKPLYVAIAERKDKRRAKLQEKFSERPASAPPSVAPRRPPLDHHGLYHQKQHALIPRHDFKYPQQLVPAIWPNEPLVPNFFPLQNQHLHPNVPHEMLPGIHGFSSGQSFRTSDIPMLDIGRGMVAAPLHEAPRSPHFPIRNFTTTLANASPELQRLLLRKPLYLHVKQIYPLLADTITDVLLKLDPRVVLYLLETPEALNATIAEVLRQHRWPN